MSRFSTVSLALLLLALGGCATNIGAGGSVKPELPALDARLRQPCQFPVAKVGDDLGILALRWKAAAICERGQRKAILGFYDDLRARLNGSGK